MPASFLMPLRETQLTQQENLNEAWLHGQQSRLVQALCGNAEAVAAIRQCPTPLRTVHAWRAAHGRQDARYSQVVLLLVLEDIINRHDQAAAASPLQWSDLEAAWQNLLSPYSIMHLVIDANMLKLQDGAYLEAKPTLHHGASPTAGQTLWTLATRLDRALRLHAQPVAVEEPPLKRRKPAASPTQQAVMTVLCVWLATLDQSAASAADPNEWIRRWSSMTPGWTKVEESFWFSAWNVALLQQDPDPERIAALMKQRPQYSSWNLWARITGLEQDVGVAFLAERLVQAANQSDDPAWYDVLQMAMMWWDPVAAWALEKQATGLDVFAGSATAPTPPAADNFDDNVQALMDASSADMNVILARLQIPGYATMVYGVLALQRDDWSLCLKMAGQLETRQGRTHAASWVLYQWLFEYFCAQGTLLDWPLKPRSALNTWTTLFQWQAGPLGRQCFVQGFEILAQLGRGSLLRDVCEYGVQRIHEAQPWSSALRVSTETGPPALTDDQRTAMDELIVRVRAGEAAVAAAPPPMATLLPVPGPRAIEPPRDEQVLVHGEENAVDVEDDRQQESPGQASSAVADATEEEEDDEVAVDDEDAMEAESEEDDQGQEHERPQKAPGDDRQEAIEVVDDSDEEQHEGVVVESEQESDEHPEAYLSANEDIAHSAEELDSEENRDESEEEEHQESEEEEERYGSEEERQESDGEHERKEPAVVEIHDDEDDGEYEAGADYPEDDQEEEAVAEAVPADEYDSENRIVNVDDDGAEADSSEEADEDVRPPVAREEIDVDENYYATAEESQEDEEELAQVLSQDESNVLPPRNYQFIPAAAGDERHVRIAAPIQPIQPTPKLDDGYLPEDEKDEDETMPPPARKREHHERDGYQGGESSLGHTEEEDEEISEAAEEEEENPQIPEPTENGEARSQAPPALDSHSLSGMSAADERGPEEESSELEEAHESDQVHFPPTPSAQTHVQAANASLEDYAAAAAQQESKMPSSHRPRSQHSSDALNRLSVGGPGRLSIGSEDEKLEESAAKPTEKTTADVDAEHTDEHEHAEHEHDDGGDEEGTVMGGETEEFEEEHGTASQDAAAGGPSTHDDTLAVEAAVAPSDPVVLSKKSSIEPPSQSQPHLQDGKLADEITIGTQDAVVGSPSTHGETSTVETVAPPDETGVVVLTEDSAPEHLRLDQSVLPKAIPVGATENVRGPPPAPEEKADAAPEAQSGFAATDRRQDEVEISGDAVAGTMLGEGGPQTVEMDSKPQAASGVFDVEVAATSSQIPGSSMLLGSTAEASPPEVERAENSMPVESEDGDEAVEVMAVERIGDDQNKMADEVLEDDGGTNRMATEKDEEADAMDDGEEEKMEDDDESERMVVDEEKMEVDECDKGEEDVEMGASNDALTVPDVDMSEEHVVPVAGLEATKPEATMVVDQISAEIAAKASEDEMATESISPMGQKDAPAESGEHVATAYSTNDDTGAREAAKSSCATAQSTVPKDEQKEAGATSDAASDGLGGSEGANEGGVKKDSDQETKELVIPVTAHQTATLDPIPEVPEEEQNPSNEHETPSKPPMGLALLLEASIADPATLSSKKGKTQPQSAQAATHADEQQKQTAVSNLPPKPKRRKHEESTATPSKRATRSSSRSATANGKGTDGGSVGSVSSRSKRLAGEKVEGDNVSAATPKKSLPPKPLRSAAPKTGGKDDHSVGSRSTRRSARLQAKAATPAQTRPTHEDDDVSVLSENSTGSIPLETKPRTRRAKKQAGSNKDDDSISTAPSKASASIRPRRLDKDPASPSRRGDESVTSSAVGSRTLRSRKTQTPETASTDTRSKRTTRSTSKMPGKKAEEEEAAHKRMTRRSRKAAPTKDDDGDSDDQDNEVESKSSLKRGTRSARKAAPKKDNDEESDDHDESESKGSRKRAAKKPPVPSTRKLRNRK